MSDCQACGTPARPEAREPLPAMLNVVQHRAPDKPRQTLHQQTVAAGFVPLAVAPNADPIVRIDGVLYG